VQTQEHDADGWGHGHFRRTTTRCRIVVDCLERSRLQDATYGDNEFDGKRDRDDDAIVDGRHGVVVDDDGDDGNDDDDDDDHYRYPHTPRQCRHDRRGEWEEILPLATYLDDGIIVGRDATFIDE
jgi:hypothetical protein